MAPALDITALRSLTAIVDCGGFHRAAETLHVSQSAVSQHVRRLEKVVGRPLMARSGRRTRLTPEGEILVAEARTILTAHDEALHRLGVESMKGGHTIVVGASEHAADYLLPAVTHQLATRFPASSVRFRLHRGARLNEDVHHGRIDVAIFLGEPGIEGGEEVGALPLSWFAMPGWTVPPPDQPVPLVAIEDPCTIRRNALRSLAGCRRTATVVVDAGYLAGVLQAARAGVGVALLADLGPAPEGLERLDALPPVAPQPMHVRSRRGAPADLLHAVGDAVRSTLKGTIASAGATALSGA